MTKRRDPGRPGCRDDEAARQDRPACRGTRFFGESLRSLSLDRRRTRIDPDHPRLSIVRQCELASVSRASFYREPAGEREENLVLMRLIDEAFLDCPFYGARQMMRHLRRLGWKAGRKRVPPTDAQDRPRPDLSSAKNQRAASTTQGLPVSVEDLSVRAAGRGLVRRCQRAAASGVSPAPRPARPRPPAGQGRSRSRPVSRPDGRMESARRPWSSRRVRA